MKTKKATVYRKSERGGGPKHTVIVAGVVVYTLIIKMLMTYNPAELFKVARDPLYDTVAYLGSQEEGEETNKTQTNKIQTTSNKTQTTTKTQTGTKPIRKWGCHRRETPLIFVHIGKAGGGEIRARLAVAAEDYSRGSMWHAPTKDNHYYPIVTEEETANGTSSKIRRGQFCNSMNGNPRKIPENNVTRPLSTGKSFEGDRYCNATTPFGILMACPENFRASGSSYRPSTCLGCDDEYYLEKVYLNKANFTEFSAAARKIKDPPPAGHTCDTIYVSHNNMGGELTWLPPRYLKEHWWDHSPWKTKSSDNEQLEKYWVSLLSDRKFRKGNIWNTADLKNRLMGLGIFLDDDYDSLDHSQRWCPAGYKGIGGSKPQIQYDRPKRTDGHWESNKSRYINCTKPIGEDVDRVFREFWRDEMVQNGNNMNVDMNMNAPDNANYSPIYASMPVHRVTMLREPFSWLISKFFWDSRIWIGNKCYNISFPTHENPTMGWVELYSYRYLFYLCGYDCETRFENKFITLEGIEAQAADNLRNSFSVVGLLHESDAFYEMLHKRLDYLDLVKDPDEFLELKAQRHDTEHRIKTRCKKLFGKEKFRERLREAVPVFAALERVYNVGVEVFEFQKAELSQCDG